MLHRGGNITLGVGDRRLRLNPLVEVWLIVLRELRKNTRSVKGLLMLGISVIGAIASVMRQPWFEEILKRAEEMGTDAYHDAKVQVWARMYRDQKVGERLADAPVRLVGFFFVAVWLTPLLVSVVGFDGISTDLQHRSIRYWTLRTRRASYYVGKFIGLWSVIAAMTLTMHVIVWTVMVSRGDASAAQIVSWGVRFWLTSLPITGAWCAVATLIGSFFKTPIMGLLLTFVTFFVMFFAGFILANVYAGLDQVSTQMSAQAPTVAAESSYGVIALRLLYPNSLDTWLLSPEPLRVLEGLSAFLGYAVATCFGGSLLFARRDV
jgi:ABC-type transport system involved in multi-copper enzyme maturation permease subunit